MNKILTLLMLSFATIVQAQPELNVALKKYGASSSHDVVIDSRRDTGEMIKEVNIVLPLTTSVSKFHAHFTPIAGKISLMEKDNIVAVIFLSGKESEFTIELPNIKLKSIKLVCFSNSENKTIELREVEIYTKEQSEIESYTKLTQNKTNVVRGMIYTPVDPSINVSRSR